jgi:hypothetical protein
MQDLVFYSVHKNLEAKESVVWNSVRGRFYYKEDIVPVFLTPKGFLLEGVPLDVKLDLQPDGCLVTAAGYQGVKVPLKAEFIMGTERYTLSHEDVEKRTEVFLDWYAYTHKLVPPLVYRLWERDRQEAEKKLRSMLHAGFNGVPTMEGVWTPGYEKWANNICRFGALPSEVSMLKWEFWWNYLPEDWKSVITFNLARFHVVESGKCLICGGNGNLMCNYTHVPHDLQGILDNIGADFLYDL